jgi:hypothetical protein
MIVRYAQVLVVLMFLAAASCDRVTTPELVGKWQLKTVGKNGVETVVDTVWYNFQSESVFLLQVYVPQEDAYMQLPGLKKQNDGVLTIRLEFDDYMEYTDWPGRERSFTIGQLSREKLELRSEEGYHYSFIKF